MNFKNRHQPEIWDDLVFADPQVEQDLRQYAEGHSYNHILLYGPYGAGKTTAAKMIAAASYGQRLSNAFIDEVEICDDIDARLAAYKMGMGWGYNCMANNTQKPYAVLNEVHKYSPKQQLTLRGIIDRREVGRFILTANDIHSLDGGVVDRCDPYELEVPPPAAWIERAQAICEAEGVGIDAAKLQTMIDDVGGSMRGTMNGLEKFVLGVKA